MSRQRLYINTAGKRQGFIKLFPIILYTLHIQNNLFLKNINTSNIIISGNALYKCAKS